MEEHKISAQVLVDIAKVVVADGKGLLAICAKQAVVVIEGASRLAKD